MTSMVAVLIPALMLVIGLVIDGGAQAAANARAERVAAAAARAASDDTADARLRGEAASAGRAIAAAQRLISAEPGMRGSVEVRTQRVEVHTEVEVPTSLLSLIGISTLRGTGSAVSTLTPDR
jgi:Flp pilus assembly protein TadG